MSNIKPEYIKYILIGTFPKKDWSKPDLKNITTIGDPLQYAILKRFLQITGEYMVNYPEMRRKFLEKFVEFEKFITAHISESKTNSDIHQQREDVKSIRDFAREYYLCKSLLKKEYHNWCDEESGIKNIPSYKPEMSFGKIFILAKNYYEKTYECTKDDKSIDIINKNKKLNIIKVALTNCLKYRREFFYNNCNDFKTITATPTLTHKHAIDQYELLLNQVNKILEENTVNMTVLYAAKKTEEIQEKMKNIKAKTPKRKSPTPKAKTPKRKAPTPKAKTPKRKSPTPKRKSPTPKRKSPVKKSRSKKSGQMNDCEPEKIRNPKTGKCVLKTGKIGRELLRAPKSPKSPKSPKIMKTREEYMDMKQSELLIICGLEKCRKSWSKTKIIDTIIGLA